MPAGSWFFQKVAAATGSPAGRSGLETGGCRYRAGTIPQTEFFVGLPEKTAMIRQGKHVKKNRIPAFTHRLCHACQSGKLIIFLYPSGSTGARGRSSANSGKTDALRSFYRSFWTGNSSVVWTRNCAISCAKRPCISLPAYGQTGLLINFAFSAPGIFAP